MSIELTEDFAAKTDEMFKAESKVELLTNKDYDWTGAHAVRVWKVSTVEMNNYARNRGAETGDNAATISRYGSISDLAAQTEEMILSRDRSFIFNIDKLDLDETVGQVEAASALARQIREVVIPEVDSYVYAKMVEGAGIKATAAALTKSNVYTSILAGSEALDNAEVPDTERVLLVTPATYTLLKQATEFDNTEVGADMRLRGVVGILDGMNVVKVPASRLPDKFGFMIAHPSACTAPIKLEHYSAHEDTVLSSGTIVTGRICYDAFVLENKANGIYLHNIT